MSISSWPDWTAAGGMMEEGMVAKCCQDMMQGSIMQQDGQASFCITGFTVYKGSFTLSGYPPV
jgi:hypothetical protein